MIASATPVLRVSDYARAKTFYTDILGFNCVEEAGEPVTGFGIFKRDSARVFLIAWDGPEASYNRWRVYFHVDDLEAEAEKIRQNGGSLTREPATTEYGMREFEIADPDGNVLAFGADA